LIINVLRSRQEHHSEMGLINVIRRNNLTTNGARE